MTSNCLVNLIYQYKFRSPRVLRGHKIYFLNTIDVKCGWQKLWLMINNRGILPVFNGKSNKNGM